MLNGPAYARFLDALALDPAVKAALYIDRDGGLRAERGQARCVRPEHQSSARAGEGRAENLYVVPWGNDLIVVVFETDDDFEALRERVDALASEHRS